MALRYSSNSVLSKFDLAVLQPISVLHSPDGLVPLTSNKYLALEESWE